MPIVDADGASAVGHDLKQAAGHDEVFDEMERLVGIGKICMKEHRRSQAEQGEDARNDARLIAENDQKAAADLNRDGPA